jgi:hypothetical protein
MRTPGTLLAFAVVALSSSLASPAVAEDYPMWEIPLEDPRWEKILLVVNSAILDAADRAKKEAPERWVKILQHINESSYLAQIKPTGGEWETVRLELPENMRILADGETFNSPLELTGQMFQYTTALGAKATVKVCQIPGTGTAFRKMNMEQFVSRLKAGETWEIVMDQVTTPCRFCRGAAIVNGGSCRQCDGKGGQTIQRNLKVCWTPGLP